MGYAPGLGSTHQFSSARPPAEQMKLKTSENNSEHIGFSSRIYIKGVYYQCIIYPNLTLAFHDWGIFHDNRGTEDAFSRHCFARVKLSMLNYSAAFARAKSLWHLSIQSELPVRTVEVNWHPSIPCSVPHGLCCFRFFTIFFFGLLRLHFLLLALCTTTNWPGSKTTKGGPWGDQRWLRMLYIYITVNHINLTR